MDKTTFDADAFNAFEHQGWETNSTSAYQEVFGPMTSLAVDGLLDAASVSSGTRVLDVATGPGYVAGRAGERGANVTGIDFSDQMLAIAARRHPGIRFVKGDAENLPFPESSFDAVVANFGILHLGHPERAAASFARVLRQGGCAALTAWNFPEQCRMMGIMIEAIGAAGAVAPASLPPGPDFFRFAADSELSSLLSGAGLQQVRVRTLNFGHQIESSDQLWRGFAEGGVRNRALLIDQPEDVQLRIRSEFNKRLDPFRTALGFKLPVSIKLASGVKAAKSARG
jgi:SAM-dependent methyltransferase